MVNTNAALVVGVKPVDNKQLRTNNNALSSNGPKMVESLLRQLSDSMPRRGSHASNFLIQRLPEGTYLMVSFMFEAGGENATQDLAQSTVIPMFEAYGFDSPTMQTIKWDINSVLFSFADEK